MGVVVARRGCGAPPQVGGLAAALQARLAQSLLILCGASHTQHWLKPLALMDIARAASGRIREYRRVEISGDYLVGVVPDLVEPCTHLFAELLANGTQYSPPASVVHVTIRRVQQGALVTVDDEGLGMHEHELAEARELVSGRRLLGLDQLGEPPTTGLAVVGRYVHRYGLIADMEPSPYGGIRVFVRIPVEYLETVPLPSDRSRRPAPPVELPSETSSTQETHAGSPTPATSGEVPVSTSEPTASFPTVATSDHPTLPSDLPTVPDTPSDASRDNGSAQLGALPRRQSRRHEPRPRLSYEPPPSVSPVDRYSPDELATFVHGIFEGHEQGSNAEETK